MISLPSIIGLLVAGFVLWFVVDSIRARDRALNACRQKCRRHQHQLLDEAVSLKKLLFARDEMGHLRLSRIYQYEYTDGSNERKVGSVKLAGREVMSIQEKSTGSAKVIAFPGAAND